MLDTNVVLCDSQSPDKYLPSLGSWGWDGGEPCCTCFSLGQGRSLSPGRALSLGESQDQRSPADLKTVLNLAWSLLYLHKQT